MSTSQLRKHLADAHRLPLHGTLPYARLLSIHQFEHRSAAQDHEHANAGEGDG